MFLDHEKNWKRRKIKEAVYINAINQTNEMDRKRILNLEKGYIWVKIRVNLIKFTDSLQRKKLGMQVDVLIGPFFKYFIQLLQFSLWGFQDMPGSKCDASTNF